MSSACEANDRGIRPKRSRYLLGENTGCPYLWVGAKVDPYGSRMTSLVGVQVWFATVCLALGIWIFAT